MQLLFKQRFFSWFDSYDIFDEEGNTLFYVQGRLSWGHRLEIHDAQNLHVGTVQEVVMTFLPRFEMYIGDEYIGDIRKQFTLFNPVYELECNDWEVRGDIFAWNYEVESAKGEQIMTAEKRLWNLTDTYAIEVHDPADALLCLMIVLAIDAAQCGSN